MSVVTRILDSVSLIPSHCADTYTPALSECQGFFLEKTSRTRDGGFCILERSHDLIMDSPDEHPLEALAFYVRRVMKEHNLTVYAVQVQARKRGGTLGKSTVDAILQKTLKNPGVFTLRELAWGLGKPVEEVIAVALGEAPLTENAGYSKSALANIWDLYKQLGKSEQRFFDRMFDMVDRELRRVLKPPSS